MGSHDCIFAGDYFPPFFLPSQKGWFEMLYAAHYFWIFGVLFEVIVVNNLMFATQFTDKIKICTVAYSFLHLRCNNLLQMLKSSRAVRLSKQPRSSYYVLLGQFRTSGQCVLNKQDGNDDWWVASSIKTFWEWGKIPPPSSKCPSTFRGNASLAWGADT